MCYDKSNLDKLALDELLDSCYILLMEQKPEEKQKELSIRSEFPKDSFEEALKVAQSIEDKNSGNPLPPQEVAIALDRSPGSSAFRILLSSSNKYGLTTGSFNTPRITITNLGKDVVEPKDEESRKSAVTDSVFKPDSFLKVFNYYKGKKVPEKSFFANTLVRDFEIPKKQADVFVDIFMKNLEHLGLVKVTTTGPWFASGTDSSSLHEQPKVPDAKEVNGEVETPTSENGDPSAPEMGLLPKDISSQKVFISHGHNKEIVNQLKELLTFGKFIPVVAEERETPSIPVPEKVLDEMKSCFAGIIHVQGEQKMIDPEGKEHQILNQNVLIEIGVAQALYGKNIILLVEKGAQLPSNLQGLYKCEYEGERLDYNATMKLLKTFNEFSQ